MNYVRTLKTLDDAACHEPLTLSGTSATIRRMSTQAPEDNAVGLFILNLFLILIGALIL